MMLCYYSRMNAWKTTAFFAVCLTILCASLFAKNVEKKAAQAPETYKTRKNYYAAASSRDLGLLAQYEAKGNQVAIQQMVKNKRLVPLGDQDVSVVQANPLSGTVIQVRPKNTGQTYWTVKEALIGGEKVVAVKQK